MDPQADKNPDSESQPSNTDLLSSAEVLAEAAQATFRHENDKIDKAGLADAAANIIDAGSDYTKVDNTSYGQYVEKAESYLRNVGHSSLDPPENRDTHQANDRPPAHEPAGGGGDSGAADAPPRPAQPTDGGGDNSEGGGGGYGQYLKMAEGLFKK